MAEIFSRTFRVEADDGLSIFVHEWKPSAPKAVVHIAHGMGEHAARYARLAEALADAGYAVVAHDHRGHGRSVASRDDLGVFGVDGWNRLVADLSTLHGRAREAHPGLPFVALGHSMGSFALQQLLLDESDRIDAAVLSGSAVLDKLTEGIDTSRPTSFDAFNEPFQPVRTEADWLSRDPAEVDAYVADPLCGFGVCAEAAADLAAAAPRLCDPSALARIRSDLPLYVLAGDADPLNAGMLLLDLLVERYRAAGLENIALRAYPGGRHEMFNETNRGEVTRELIAWLDGAIESSR